MKKRLVLMLIVAVFFVPAMASQTINYGDITYSPGFTATNFSNIWNLMNCDLTLSYTIDMTGVTQTVAYETPYVEVGIRQVGAGNFNPGPFNTYQGGAGGWMTSLVGDLSTNPNLLDHDDKHNLSASGGRGEQDYDALGADNVVSPFGTFNNLGIWFDRDGVDPWQDTTYANTDGIYNIEIVFHAVDTGLGTMFATINGLATGFILADSSTIIPAGLSFTGDMTQMQVFAGAWYTGGAGGTVIVSDITAQGCVVPVPGAILLGGIGAGLVGWMKRRKSF